MEVKRSLSCDLAMSAQVVTRWFSLHLFCILLQRKLQRKALPEPHPGGALCLSWREVRREPLLMWRVFMTGPRELVFPRQQCQSGSLPPVASRSGPVHALVHWSGAGNSAVSNRRAEASAGLKNGLGCIRRGHQVSSMMGRSSKDDRGVKAIVVLVIDAYRIPTVTNPDKTEP
jgi:hypothetical protein